MKSRIFVAALAIVGLGILDAQTANAQTQYFDDGAATGRWNNAGNWDANGCDANIGGAVPVAGDTVIICEDKRVTLNMNTPALGQLAVRGGATVVIPEFTMTIQSSVRETHDIEGLIELNHADAVLRFVTNNAILGGDGIIKMNFAAAEIQLDDKVTVVNQVTIKGRGVIGEGPEEEGGTFINEGMVHANVNGTLDLQENTYREGHTGVYAVSHPDAILEFSNSIFDATNLASDFLVLKGTLDIRAPMDTIGNLDYFDGATVQVTGEAKWGHAYLRPLVEED